VAIVTETPVAERAPAPAYRSVFLKLVLVMLGMASCLLVLVAGFFWLIVSPTVGASIDRMLDDYARRFAQESPGEAEARRLAERLELQVRYEGPDGSWTTDQRLPTIAEAQQAAGGQEVIGASGHSRHLVRAPNGGHYLLEWEFGRRNAAAHDKLLLLLLAMMLAVLVVAHAVLRRGLRPLRELQTGVARLGRGELEVTLAVQAHDEFGALTAAFNTMAAGIREQVRARDQMLLDVSHELRSPLTRLKVALALLPESAKKTQAEADVSEMESLVAELLEFERLRDGRALRLARLDLVPLLHEVARPYQGELPGVLVGCPEVLLLDADAEALRRMFRNLLGNAVKYALPDSRPVEVTASSESSQVVVRIVDDGPGIPEADIGRIFEPFFRVDRSRSRKTGGYGLGLGICRRIATAHGGTISVANAPGRGACFTVTLPSAAAHTPAHGSC
jgi:signal transduction histidine kinase